MTLIEQKTLWLGADLAGRESAPKPREPEPPPPDPTRGPRPYPVDDPGIADPRNLPGSEPDYLPGRPDGPPATM